MATTVLLVMKGRGNIRVMAEALASIGHAGVGVPDNTSLDAALSRSGGSCIALVDSSDFSPSDDRRLYQTLRNHQVRFIVFAGPHNIAGGGRALRHGAAAFLQKPIKKPALLELVTSVAGKATAVQSTTVQSPATQSTAGQSREV